MLHKIPMFINSPPSPSNIMIPIQNKFNATYIYKRKSYATYTTLITYATHTKISLYQPLKNQTDVSWIK